MSLVIAGLAALLLVGVLASAWFVRGGPLAGRVGYALVFAVGGAPVLASILALATSRPVSGLLAWIVVAGLLVLFGTLHGATRLRHLRVERPTGDDALLLGLTAVVALLAGLHHTDAELLTNLAAYLDTGEAKCFYMQTYQLVPGLNEGEAGLRPELFFDVINTPGNTLITAGLMPLVGPQAFRVLYVVFVAAAFLFLRLLLVDLGARRWTATIAALFAVGNPYVLSIEVLDRNLMAFALSAVLLHALRAHRRCHLLHGLLFGALAGTGLRFLPAIHLAPVIALYVAGRAPWRGYLTFAGGAAALFAINLPHLGHHGLHSLGETEPLWRLALSAVTDHGRTPFVPYPNAELYALNLLGHLGLLAGAAALVGLVVGWRRERLFAACLLWLLAVPFVVLASQRDWIEGEKLRILLSAGAVWSLGFGLGLDHLLRRDRLLRRVVAAGAALALVACASLLMARVDALADPMTYARKPLYQTESPAYVQRVRGAFARHNLLPDYGRPFLKLDRARKVRQVRSIRAALFGPASGRAGTPWIARWLPTVEPPAAPVQTDPGDAITLRIDLERLVHAPGEAATVEPGEARTFVDLTDSRRLDLALKQVDVTWQPEPLPVVAFPLQPESAALGELVIELNAFRGFGDDELGFVRVGPVHQWIDEDQRDRVLAAGMTALPQPDYDPSVVVRVPRGTHVLIRNWIVDGVAGVAHRIDSWSVRVGEDDVPRTTFHAYEPESYL